MRKLKLALLSLITTPIYLALSVWGEGGWSAFTAKPAVVTVAAITLLAGVVGVFSDGNVSSGVREDKGNRWALYSLVALSLLAGVVPAFFDGRSLWPIDGEAVRWAGVVIYSAGLVTRLVPVFVLGYRFSGLVAIQPGHTLVTTGVYALVRNPSYLGLVVMTLGWALAFNSWVGVLLTALLAPPLIGRIRSEERMLAGQFGEAFEAWRARTWRLIPWIY